MKVGIALGCGRSLGQARMANPPFPNVSSTWAFVGSGRVGRVFSPERGALHAGGSSRNRPGCKHDCSRRFSSHVGSWEPPLPEAGGEQTDRGFCPGRCSPFRGPHWLRQEMPATQRGVGLVGLGSHKPRLTGPGSEGRGSCRARSHCPPRWGPLEPEAISPAAAARRTVDGCPQVGPGVLPHRGTKSVGPSCDLDSDSPIEER